MKRILIIWALLISVCFAQSKAGFYVVGGKIITVQDTSSRKYLKAIEDAGVVPSALQNFTSNYLVTTEKAIGTWTLIKAQYPFIGGTSATHALNLVKPTGLTADFNLTFPNGATHNATGLQGNGSNQYGETFLNQNSLNDDSYISCYVTADGTGTQFTYMGVSNTNSGADGLYLNANTASGGVTGGRANSNSTLSTAYGASRKGGRAVFRIGTSMYFMYKNLMLSNTLTVSTKNNYSLTILGQRVDVSSVVSTGIDILGSVLIAENFTVTKAIQQSHIVTFSQSILGRQ